MSGCLHSSRAGFACTRRSPPNPCSHVAIVLVGFGYASELLDAFLLDCASSLRHVLRANGGDPLAVDAKAAKPESDYYRSLRRRSCDAFCQSFTLLSELRCNPTS